MTTIEREFEKFKALHKYVILKAKIMQYFNDLEVDLPQIPDFMRRGQTPEDKANIELQNLLMLPDGGKLFNELYETAWAEMADILP